MSYAIIDLLPYSEDIILSSLKDRIRVIALLKFIYDSMHSALTAYLDKQYHCFDAQVSENLCQIRACQLLDIVDDNFQRDSLFFLRKKASDTIKRLNQIQTEYSNAFGKRHSHYLKEIDQNIVLSDFLSAKKLNSELSFLGYFITQLYILSKYKLISHYNISHGINYDALCKALEIASKTLAKKVVHRLQRNIAKASCEFIFSLTKLIQSDNQSKFLLQTLYTQDEVYRQVLPCYEVTKILLNFLYQRRKKITVSVTHIFNFREENISFDLEPSEVENQFVLSKSTQLSQKPHVIFVGICKHIGKTHISREKYIERFLRIGLENIILYNMAQHPQFSGVLLDDKKYNPYSKIDTGNLQNSYINHIRERENKFLEDKSLAKKLGCSQQNPTLFLLTHVRYAIPSLVLAPTLTERKLPALLVNAI